MRRYADITAIGKPRHEDASGVVYDAIDSDTPPWSDTITFAVFFVPMFDLAKDNGYLLSFTGSANNPGLYLRADHEVRFYVTTPQGFPYASAFGGFKANQLNLVLGTYYRGRLFVYLNGDSGEAYTTTDITTAGDMKLRLCARGDGLARYEHGYIAGVVVSNDTPLLTELDVNEWIYGTLAEDLREGRPIRHWKESPQVGNDYVWWGNDVGANWTDLVSSARLEVGPDLTIASKSVPGRITGGTAPTTPLLDFADGDFERLTEASAEIFPGIVNWYNPNVPRIFPDGTWLFEGPSTNLVNNPEDPALWDFTNASPGATGLLAPDNDTDAKAVQFGGVGNGRAETTLGVTPSSGVNHTASLFARRVSGSNNPSGVELRTVALDGTLLNPNYTFPTPDIWARIANTYDMGTGATAPLAGIEANSPESLNEEWAAWGLQVEAFPFPTSYIRSGPTVERGRELLTFTGAQVPSALTSGRWEFDVYPRFDSVSGSNGVFFYPLSFESGAGSDGILFRESTSRIRIVCGGTTTEITGLTVNSPLQKLTFRVDASAQELTLSGFDVGDGTYAFSGSGWSGGLRVGSRFNAATQPFYGRVSMPRAW